MGRNHLISYEKQAYDWQFAARKIVNLANSKRKQWSLVILIPVISVALTIAIIPDFDYLPPLKRNTVDAFVTVPTGISLEYAENELTAHWSNDLNHLLEESASTPAVHYAIVFFNPFVGLVSIRPKDMDDAESLLALLQEKILPTLPGMEVFTYRANVLTTSDDGRSIAINLYSANHEQLDGVARLAVERIPKIVENAFVSSDPQIDQGQPQFLFQPIDDVLSKAGWSRADSRKNSRWIVPW